MPPPSGACTDPGTHCLLSRIGAIPPQGVRIVAARGQQAASQGLGQSSNGLDSLRCPSLGTLGFLLCMTLRMEAGQA